MRIRAGVTAAVAVLAVLLVAVPAQAGQTADIVSATPTPGSSLDPTGAFFKVAAKPGDTFTTSIRVTNPNDHGITVRLAGVDGLTQSTTGSVFASPLDTQKTTGTWITPQDLEFNLGAHASRDEPFTVHVPIDAGPGVHLGGISAYSPLPDTTSTTQGGFHVDLKVQPARTIGVEVDLPGPAVPNLVVTGAKPAVSGSGVDLDVAIANQGTGYAHGNGVITVDETNLRHEFTIDTFVPGTSIEYPTQWLHDARKGTYHVHAVLQYEGGRVTRWDGTVTVDDATAKAFANVKVPDALATRNPAPSNGSTNMLVVALVAVGTVLALAALGVIAFALANRRRRRPRRGARASRAMPVTTDEGSSRQDRRHRRNSSRGRHGRTRTGRAQATSRTGRRR